MADAERSPGRLSRQRLGEMVQSGEVDTVLTVFPDLYGRLVGKRITAAFFLAEWTLPGAWCGPETRTASCAASRTFRL